MANDAHEARVRAFLQEAETSDPERYAVLCARFPVKSSAQLGHISRHELTLAGAFSDTDRALGGVRRATVALSIRQRTRLRDRAAEYDEYGQYREQPGGTLPLTQEDRTLRRVDWSESLSGWRGLESI